MTVPCLPLFAGFGVLKRHNSEYGKTHALLVRWYQDEKARRQTKRERAQGRSKIWKQRAEIV